MCRYTVALFAPEEVRNARTGEAAAAVAAARAAATVGLEPFTLFWRHCRQNTT